MSKHTPGPWVAQKHDSEKQSILWDCYRILSDGRALDDWRADIAATPGDTEQDRANAALIAAAPDLLEACEAALTFMRSLYLDRDAGVEAKLQGVIRKARGE